MSTASPHGSPRFRRANLPLGSITELPEHASSGSSSGVRVRRHQSRSSRFGGDISGLPMWETESADEDVRVNEGLYLSTSSVDVGAATLFGRPRESRFSSSNSSFVQWRQSPPVVKKWIVDRDCGICFEVAVNPRRTRCCGKLFCSEHLIDWLGGEAIAGSCPSCQTLCSIRANTISLAPPPKPTMKRPWPCQCCQIQSTSTNLARHSRSLSTPSSPYHSPSLPSGSLPSSPSPPHSPLACTCYVSGSTSPTPPLPRASPPYYAPSRPNTPCSGTDSPEGLQSHSTTSSSYNNSDPSFVTTTTGTFVVVREDTGGLLILAALTFCIYVFLT